MYFPSPAQRNAVSTPSALRINNFITTLAVALVAALVVFSALNATAARAEKIGKVNVTSCATAIKAVNYTVKRVALRKVEIKYLRTNNAKRNKRAKLQLKKARTAAAAARAAVRKYCAGAQGVNSQSGPCFTAIETFERSVTLAATTRIKSKRVKKGKKLSKKQARRRAKTLKLLDDKVKKNLSLINTACANPGDSGNGGSGDGGSGDGGGNGGGGNTDTTAPSLTVNGPSGTIGNTNPTYTVDSDDASASITCKLDDGAAVSVAVGGTYNPGTLSEGTHTITCVATDAAGNETTTTKTVTIDTTGPATTISVASVTNDTTPAVELGSNEAGTTFECKLDDGEYQSVPAAFDIVPALSEGTYTLTCRGTDAAGNVGAPTSQSIEIDSSAPDLDVSGPSGATNDTTPSYVPTTTDANATITCSVDGGSPTVVASGDTFTAGPLAEGAHTISCTADDGNGNSATVEKQIVVDTTAPGAPVIGGPSTSNDDTPSFPVTSDPNSTTVCSVDGGQQQQTVASGESYNPTLSDGVHVITCVTTDEAGNESVTTKTVTIDTTGPVVTVTVTSPTNDNTPHVDLGSNEAGTTFECKLDDGEYVSVPASFDIEPALDEGSHTLTCRGTDAAGNVSSTEVKTVTVDTTAPTLTMSGPSGLQPDSTPTYTLTPSEGGATTQCAIDGGAYANVSSPYTTTDLVEGTHTISCRAVDAAGNVGPSVSKITTIGTAYTDPVTKTANGNWGLLCTPLDFLLPLGCPNGVVSHTIPAHPNGLTGNYQVNLSGFINNVCSIGGIFPSYTMNIVVDGQSVASDTEGGFIDLLCLLPIDVAAQKLNLTLSSATAHTISLNLRSNLQLSVFPTYDTASLSVDIVQL